MDNKGRNVNERDDKVAITLISNNNNNNNIIHSIKNLTFPTFEQSNV